MRDVPGLYRALIRPRRPADVVDRLTRVLVAPLEAERGIIGNPALVLDVVRLGIADSGLRAKAVGSGQDLTARHMENMNSGADRATVGGAGAGNRGDSLLLRHRLVEPDEHDAVLVHGR